MSLLKEDWMDEGRCRGMDPDLFYPHRGDMAGLAAAQAVCAECEVRRACLDYGLGEKQGVWGGFSDRERRRIRRARRLPEPPEWGANALMGLLKARDTTEIPGKQSGYQQAVG